MFCYVVRENVCDIIVYDILHDIVLFHTWFLTLCCFWLLFVRCCLSVILLSNLPGKKRKHNGYYDKSSLNKEMDISRNEVNMANNRGNIGSK